MMVRYDMCGMGQMSAAPKGVLHMIRMYDIIAKKRDGQRLTEEEIRAVIHGCTSGEIPDYQTAAWLMAVYLRGMDAGKFRRISVGQFIGYCNH